MHPNEVKTVRDLHMAGVRFTVDLECVDGARSVLLEVKDVPLYMREPQRWKARAWGVSLEDYLAWEKAGGFPQCVAKTATGRRCKNGIAGRLVDPPAFADLQGGYCAVHDERKGRE